MRTLKINNNSSTEGLCNKHNVLPDTEYRIISISESGKFYYIANPLHKGMGDLKNAAWIAISEEECTIINH